MEAPMVMGSLAWDQPGALAPSIRPTTATVTTTAEAVTRLMAPSSLARCRASSDVAVRPRLDVVLQLVPDRDDAARLGDQEDDHDEAEDDQLGLFRVDHVGGQDRPHVGGEEAQ